MDRDPKRAAMRERVAAFGVAIVRFCRLLVQRHESRTIGNQLLRAGTSVAANYHGALRARSKAEFIAKLGLVNEESDEAVVWLSMIRDSGLDQSEELLRLLREATEIRAIIAVSRRTALVNERKRQKAHWSGTRPRRR